MLGEALANRVGSGGQVKTQQFANAGEALLALQALTRAKVKQGYSERLTALTRLA